MFKYYREMFNPKCYLKEGKAVPVCISVSNELAVWERLLATHYIKCNISVVSVWGEYFDILNIKYEPLLVSLV